LSLGLEYKDVEEETTMVGIPESIRSREIDYLTLSVAFTSNYREKDIFTVFNISANYGLRGVGSSREEFHDMRYLAQPNFFYLKVGVKHTRPLFFGDSIALSLQGQLANSPLISNEQFTAGGAGTVRGYHQSQAMGDDGLIASVEWHTPRLLNKEEDDGNEFYALLFWDGASLHLQDVLPDEESQSNLSSAGAGLRFRMGSSLDANLDWAQVFETSGNTSGSVEKGDSRWHAYFNYAF
jgi:hemolysin activation/secretion protein